MLKDKFIWQSIRCLKIVLDKNNAMFCCFYQICTTQLIRNCTFQVQVFMSQPYNKPFIYARLLGVQREISRLSLGLFLRNTPQSVGKKFNLLISIEQAKFRNTSLQNHFTHFSLHIFSKQICSCSFLVSLFLNCPGCTKAGQRHPLDGVKMLENIYKL